MYVSGVTRSIRADYQHPDVLVTSQNAAYSTSYGQYRGFISIIWHSRYKVDSCWYNCPHRGIGVNYQHPDVLVTSQNAAYSTSYGQYRGFSSIIWHSRYKVDSCWYNCPHRGIGVNYQHPDVLVTSQNAAYSTSYGQYRGFISIIWHSRYKVDSCWYNCPHRGIGVNYQHPDVLVTSQNAAYSTSYGQYRGFSSIIWHSRYKVDSCWYNCPHRGIGVNYQHPDVLVTSQDAAYSTSYGQYRGFSSIIWHSRYKVDSCWYNCPHRGIGVNYQHPDVLVTSQNAAYSTSYGQYRGFSSIIWHSRYKVDSCWYNCPHRGIGVNYQHPDVLVTSQNAAYSTSYGQYRGFSSIIWHSRYKVDSCWYNCPHRGIGVNYQHPDVLVTS
ncbi:hypothetical protein J6590_030108 [Homalodisca vitripennis]|nr:hypothetical protein J6590_030108 [Homalodisca vitripennis]